MKLPKIMFRKPASNPQAVADAALENGAKSKSGRRRHDLIDSASPGRNLNLDRRASNSDRRVNHDHNYKGPARRYTIDRRMSLNDRRDET